MNKIIFFLLILAAVAYFVGEQRRSQNQSSEVTASPNPQYLEVHVNLSIASRTFDQVVLIKADDPADCSSKQGTLENVYGEAAHKAGQDWQIQSSECNPELEDRYARLFDNTPATTTYLSLGRGDDHERETRIITWGLTGVEGDKLCDKLSQTERTRRKGSVQCIRAEHV